MHSKSFLNECQLLHRAGLAAPFEIGQIVARGFADLGIEEFIIVPGEQMISLCTGSISSLADREHLFWVPNIHEMTLELMERGCKIHSITFEEERYWSLSLTTADGRKRAFVSPVLESSIAQALREEIAHKEDVFN